MAFSTLNYFRALQDFGRVKKLGHTLFYCVPGAVYTFKFHKVTITFYSEIKSRSVRLPRHDEKIHSSGQVHESVK